MWGRTLALARHQKAAPDRLRTQRRDEHRVRLRILGREPRLQRRRPLCSLATLQRRESDVQVWMINVARGTYQLERVRFEALNPTFMLAVVKSAG